MPVFSSSTFQVHLNFKLILRFENLTKANVSAAQSCAHNLRVSVLFQLYHFDSAH